MSPPYLPAAADLVVRSGYQGKLHRARSGSSGRVTTHARCALSTVEIVGKSIPPGTPVRRLCRYPWCFRAEVVAAGVDPHTGHVSRQTPMPKPGRVVPAVAP